MRLLLRRLFGLPSQHNVVDTSQRLFSAGLVREAIDRLSTQVRAAPSADIEICLMAMRHRGFFHVQHPQGAPHWPPVAQASPFAPGVIPSVEKDHLSASMLAQGIQGHGALIVRGLLSSAQISTMTAAIDSAIKAADVEPDSRDEEQQAWFTPLQPCPEGGEQKIARKWVRDGGGVLAADSPRGFFKLIETLGQSGVLPVLADYLGETPALSVKKTTLRRVSPKSNSGWHQDGAFLGQDIRTVNLWIALTDCGVDAPSMDMVPTRLPGIVPAGNGEASFSWSVDDAAVLAAAGDTPPVRLHFKAGDAILFDERNLHRTAVDPGMTQERYAIEAWFFAPSCYPLNQLPLLC